MRFREFLIEDRVDFIAKQSGDKILSAYKNDTGLKPKFVTPVEILRYLDKKELSRNENK